jgi:hypothetical protein
VERNIIIPLMLITIQKASIQAGIKGPFQENYPKLSNKYRKSTALQKNCRLLHRKNLI